MITRGAAGGNRKASRFVAWRPGIAPQDDGFMVASVMTSNVPQTSQTDDHIHEFPATSCPKHQGPWRAAELKSYVGMPG